MEITANYNQASSILDSEIKAQETEAVYQVKLMKMMQESDAVVGDLLQDTAEISQEAMNRYLAEINSKVLS